MSMTQDQRRGHSLECLFTLFRNPVPALVADEHEVVLLQGFSTQFRCDGNLSMGSLG